MHHRLLIVVGIVLCCSKHACSCSCLCIDHLKPDSLLAAACASGLPGEPDSLLRTDLRRYPVWFLGTIASISTETSAQVMTESVKVVVDTVLRGQLSLDTLTVANIVNGANCLRSAAPLAGLSFLGHVGSGPQPANLHDVGIFMGDCGIGFAGYLVKGECVLRAVVSTGERIVNGQPAVGCLEPAVSTFNLNALFAPTTARDPGRRPAASGTNVAPACRFTIHGRRIAVARPCAVSILVVNRGRSAAPSIKRITPSVPRTAPPAKK